MNLRFFTDPIYSFVVNRIILLPRNMLLKHKAEKYLMGKFTGNASNKIKRNNHKNSIDILTVAFNNSEIIQFQYKMIKKFLIDNHAYIVIDNSSDADVSKEIERFCNKMKIIYIKLEINPYSGIIGSLSHGLAIDWAHRHVILSRNAKYFGIIDHDIFPIKKTSLIDKIKKQKLYGHFQQRGNRWYMWPGFSFFDKSIFKNKQPKFRPIWGLDTGGGNWPIIYKYLDKNKLEWPQHSYIKYNDNEIIQKSSIERIDDWLHLIAASGWMDGKKKVAINEKTIRELLKRNKNDN